MLAPNKAQTGRFIFCPLLPSPDQREEVQAAADSTGTLFPSLLPSKTSSQCNYSQQITYQALPLLPLPAPAKIPKIVSQTRFVYLKKTDLY